MPGLTFQAGADSFKVSRDPRTGIVSATAKCFAPDLATAYTAAPLDIGIPNIIEWNPRQISRVDAGEVGYHVIVGYEGHPEPADSGEFYEIEGSTTEDPIETHWNYAVLLNNYNGQEDAQGHAQWPATLTDGSGNSGRNPMHGVQSWPAPGLIWNHNWVSETLPVSIVQQLGTLAKTLDGNPPQLSGGRVWLCIRVRARQRGNVWQMQTSWQLSGPKGYAPEMYQQI